ncbi:NAD(P)/FAD-dependent oxidoreductase [Ammoniphilus sp. CFH 90114]|uniref:NAD(P)/FAD-dependent oxidoreductase n=1 Tax=Ammoniphilus sp. CFH 90114 TaxID=2493665 RepID=UPI00100F2AF0|nr:NAD(P)-binding protein [Ammoniphilus sp. CFH 90114]RXT03834.1 hypothetical protein EIZ39_22930 [Ammoniphilus sp. CFH 90114]
MRVAIYGAGVSGLACAFELERLGFAGEIHLFEEKHGVGVGNLWIEFISELFNRPVVDMFAYLGQHHNLYLSPLHTIEGSFNFGPTKMAKYDGYVGHTVARGNHELSIEKQIFKLVRSPVHFNSQYTLKELQSEYDIVILASGNLHDVPSEIGVRVDRYVHFYHAIVEGEFDPKRVKMWLNHHYGPQGYAYLIPESEKLAMISLTTPVQEFQLVKGWNRLINEVWGDKIKIRNLHEVRNAPLGEPMVRQYKNLFLIGNAGGAILPAMGFGLFRAILSGLLAADAIVNNKDYEALLVKHKKEYQWSLALRNMLEMLDNEQFDQVVDGMDSLMGRYMLNAGSVNFLRVAGRLLATFTRQTKKSFPVTGTLLEFEGRTVEENQHR